jgi:hypothetical protein
LVIISEEMSPRPTGALVVPIEETPIFPNPEDGMVIT